MLLVVERDVEDEECDVVVGVGFELVEQGVAELLGECVGECVGGATQPGEGDVEPSRRCSMSPSV